MRASPKRGSELQAVERDLAQAREELHAAVRAAHEAGESYSAIARVLGVTRQRAAEIVERGRS